MIFVDTGVWFARYVAADVDHAAATAWFASASDRLLTTDSRLYCALAVVVAVIVATQT